MVKKIFFSIVAIIVLTQSIFAEDPKDSVSQKKNIELETNGSFSQSFRSGIVDSKPAKAFDSEIFESITKVNGGANVKFGMYELSISIQDTFTTYYITDNNVIAYNNKVGGRVGNSFVINPGFRIFGDFETIYENEIIPSSNLAGTLKLAPIVGVSFTIEMFSLSISESLPFTIDMENSVLSLIEIEGLYELGFKPGFGLEVLAAYNVIAPVDPTGKTTVTPEQELKVLALWPVKSLQPQVGTVMFNDDERIVWGFTAGIGILNKTWQITGEYQGGYNFTSTLWENLFVASFSLSL